MEYALALLVFWTVVFVPIGLAVHWLVLGNSARVQALPLALVSGLAVGVVLLGAARQAGIGAGATWLPVTLLVASVLACVAFWRWGVAWRSRELAGALLCLLLAVFLMQLPVFDAPGSGPLGYGTGYEPVPQVTTVQGAIAEGTARNAAVKAAQSTTGRRFTGFEQLAAFTVAAGDRDDGGGRTIDTASTWTAYSLHALLAGLLGVLTVLPLFVLARWRGIGWLGVLVLLLVGGTSPMLFLAMALAQGPAVAAVPFTTAAVLSLLIARRDRGWYALAALNSAAVLLIVGPLGLLPIALVAGSWMLLNRYAREHLAHTDVPVTRDRPIVLGALVGMLALFGSASALIHAPGLPWQRLNESLGAALVMWPLAWIGSDLRASGPAAPPEFALWMIGPALLVIAVAYGVARKEARELAMLSGLLGCLVLGAAGWLVDHSGGASFIEYTWLVASPLLAMVAVRTVGLARAAGQEADAGRFAGMGPVLIVAVLALFSVAAATVSGSRMVHAPQLAAPDIKGGELLIAAGDPWLAYVLDGERARGGHVDADRMSKERNPHSNQSLVYGNYEAVVLSSNPLASDPPSRYREEKLLDNYSARLFVDTRADLQKNSTTEGDIEPAPSGGSSATAAERTSAAEADTPPKPSTRTLAKNEERPRRHDPVERKGATGSEPGGLLVPGRNFSRCTLARLQPCEVERPATVGSCSRSDVAKARSGLDPNNSKRKRAAAAQALTALSGPLQPDSRLVAVGPGLGRGVGGALDGDEEGAANGPATDLQFRSIEDLQLQPRDPQLLGVACWKLNLDNDTRWLRVHVRDVGLILPSTDAVKSGPVNAFDEVLGPGEDEVSLASTPAASTVSGVSSSVA